MHPIPKTKYYVACSKHTCYYDTIHFDARRMHQTETTEGHSLVLKLHEVKHHCLREANLTFVSVSHADLSVPGQESLQQEDIPAEIPREAIYIFWKNWASFCHRTPVIVNIYITSGISENPLLFRCLVVLWWSIWLRNRILGHPNSFFLIERRPLETTCAIS